MRLVVVLVVIAACGDNLDPDLDEGANSGTRLKLRYYDFGDVRQLAGIRDSERDEDCYPNAWVDGKTYCTPRANARTVFADATCTQRVGFTDLLQSCTLPPPTYFIDRDSSEACAAPRVAHLYPRGAKIALALYWNKKSDGTCNGPFSNTSYEYYTLGAEVTVADLVATPITSRPTTGRLGQRQHQSADGLRYPLTDRLQDASLGSDCAPTSDAPGSTTGRCVPSNSGSTFYFRDAACTVPTTHYLATCPAPSAAVQEGTCPEEPARYFAVTEKLTPSTVYAGPMCTALDPSTDITYYGVGQELTLATVSRVRGQGSGRLQPIHYTTREGLHIRDTPMFDSQLGMECSLHVQADGSVVCVPAAHSAGTYYEDAGCTTRIELAVVERGKAGCSPLPLLSYVSRYKLTPSCEATLELYRFGTQYTGPVFIGNSTTCNAFVEPDLRLFRVGAAVPQSELAAGTLVIE